LSWKNEEAPFNCYYAGGEPRRLGTTGIAVEVADTLAEAMGYGHKWHTHKGHIIAFAGVSLRKQQRGVHSLCFRLGNVDAFVGFFRQNPDQFPEYEDII